jgi:hypothetical protein
VHQVAFIGFIQLWITYPWWAAFVLLKDTPPADIIRAIRLVAAGDALLSPSVTRTLIERFSADPAASRRAAAEESVRALTDRDHGPRRRPGLTLRCG